VLDCQSREVSIGDQVARGPQRLQELTQNDVVPSGRVDDDDRRLRQPTINEVEGLRQVQWTLEHGGTGRQADERRQHGRVTTRPRRSVRLGDQQAELR